MSSLVGSVQRGLAGLVGRHPLDIAGWNLEESGALRKGCWDGVSSIEDALTQTDSRLAEIAGVTSSDRVLDAGCGFGSTGLYLAERFGCESVGITRSERECEGARKRADARGLAGLARFEIMDYTKTTFENESFDVIYAIESLIYLTDKSLFAREALRLLRPGGRLIVADQYRTKQQPNKVEQRLIKVWSRGYGGFKLITPFEFESVLEGSGFTEVRMIDWTKNILPSSRILFRHSLWSVPYFATRRLLGSKSSSYELHFFRSAQAEFLAFTFGVGAYCVFSATKQASAE